MKVLDLFSGIGGFSLGLELSGWKTVAFCELEPTAQEVLARHWPGVPVFADVKKLSTGNLNQKIDIICGGFPCQDISTMGKMAGIDGARSGLWKEYCRLINEIKPKFAIIENVPNLRKKGLSRVLGDLWQIGYDAEWHCVPASALGAPHQRDRIWIISYPACVDKNRLPLRTQEEITRFRNDGKNSQNLQGDREAWGFIQIFKRKALKICKCTRGKEWWGLEPNLSRLSDDRLNPDWVEWLMGFPTGWTQGLKRRNRLKLLGNSLIPFIPEAIANSINEHIKHTK
jgi:DNA (cytosine-5)-methyltransferase 1